MAIIHKATLSPSKLELIADYLPKQPWFIQDGTPELIGAYRFDDPAGQVGLETHVVTAGERFYQVPLTYRGYELAGAEEWLVGTMDHSVLGKRWVYDACADPIYVKALATAILTGQKEAELIVDGEPEPRPSTVTVKGSGTLDGGVPALSASAPVSGSGVTIIDAGELRLKVARVLDVAADTSAGTAAAQELHGELILNGQWAGLEEPVELASVVRN
ncbi:CG0192-related protein [Paenarthrobacter nitroguajacolicus]|uniref:CG0192-related protein n=1 Tax=Paenarthrobacter nitroguajacolicus TaxID=211146 RepID=UPI003AE33301